MEIIAEGLWGLADLHETQGEIGKTIKCLEAICKSQVSLLPITEIKTRLRIATLLLKHTHNINHAKAHLERSQLLLKSIPACFDLKCRTFSLLSQCYQIFGAISNQKQTISKGLELISKSGDGFGEKLWSCNFYSQLGNALAIEGDYRGSIDALEKGFSCATEIFNPELQMFFATSMLHVHLMQWDDANLVERAVEKCSEVWELIPPDKKQHCHGLFLYNELLHTFYRLRICDYKNAGQHVDRLDAAMKDDLQKTQQIHKLELAPAPIDGEWLPKSAVYALVDLMVVILGRPKGLFKDCARRIQSGLQVIQAELTKLGITDGAREVDLHHSSISIAGVYLVLLMQFLENKVAIDLTRSEFVEAQGALIQMKNWFSRYPIILQGCASIIQILRGHYAHSLRCFNEAAYHFTEAAKLTESKSTQAMCQIYAAVSYICIGDAEASSQALDLIGPVYSIMDSYVGVREKTGVLFAYGLILMKQHNLQEARIRLASGLRISHQHLGNIQLVSQYLTILGSLALTLHDNVQAKEILKSSLTLAKTLYDLPTQIWVLSVLTALYQELGERGNEMENAEYERKKEEDLNKRLADARSSLYHIELIEKVRVEVKQPEGLDVRRSSGGPSMRTELDIPESVGLMTPPPGSASRLVDVVETVRRSKRRI